MLRGDGFRQEGGDVSRQDFTDRLRQSDLLVLLCGADTAASPYVNAEIAQALALRAARQMTILPVFLGGHVSMPPALDFRVQGIHLTTSFPRSLASGWPAG